MVEQQNVVQWVYSSRNNEELGKRYDHWAKSYDEDLDRDFGWSGPLRTVEMVTKYVPTNARVLDAGAGTGLVGKLLADQGYTDLVAMDLSAGTLEEAGKKSVYREFHQMVMGARLDFLTNSLVIRYLTHPSQCARIQAWKRNMLTFKLSCAGPMQSVDPT